MLSLVTCRADSTEWLANRQMHDPPLFIALAGARALMGAPLFIALFSFVRAGRFVLN